MMYRKITTLLLTIFLSIFAQAHSLCLIDMRMGLPESRIRQIKQMPDGRIAIATTATIEVYDGTRFTSYKLLPSSAYPLPNYSGNRQLTCDKSGRIWLRHDRQLYVVDTHNEKVINNVDSLMKVLHLDEGQIIAWSKKRAPESYHGIKDVTCMEHDSYGGLWIGTKENGIWYENPQRTKQFKTEKKPFVYNRIPNFCSSRTSRLSAQYAFQATNCTWDIPKGYAFLGTRKGLMIFDSSNHYIGTIDEHDGLSTNNIQAIIMDKKHQIWLATANTIVRVRETGKNKFDITHYGELDGIHVNGKEFRTCQIHQDSTGLITVGFVGGTVSFMPDSIIAQRYTFHFPKPLEEGCSNDSQSHLPWYVISLIALIGVLGTCGGYFFYKKRKYAKQKPLPDFNTVLQIEKEAIEPLKNQESKRLSDYQFLHQIKECVKTNFSNEDFSVQMLGEMMAMDRTGLYRRMVDMTGITPSNYIKKVRMDVAANLLCDSDLPISEIAIKTGFSTTKYFNKVFKDTYKVSAVEFRNAKQTPKD